jgi:uncharacterized protein (TIGR04168 family)
MQSADSLRIAVIGDVHDQWDVQDEQALYALDVDLVLFVGDFGNENVQLVRQLAAIALPKAVILGNHDAWYSATKWGREKCPYDRHQEDWVQAQLDALGTIHVGFGHLDFPDLGLAVVGSRPFSWGGPKWQNKSFYRDRYGIETFDAAAEQIITAAQAARSTTLIMLGHCGPAGLGSAPEDPCGRDWKPLGGDYGDPDFATAIQTLQQAGRQIPLVAFGHMHHRLRHRQDRLRRAIAADPQGTIYLNAARAPRIVRNGNQFERNFSLVSLQGGQVRTVQLAWVRDDHQISRVETLYQAQVTAPTGTNK